MDIVCDFCGEEMTDLGALLFSPPYQGMTWKYHMCKKCYKRMKEEFPAMFDNEEGK